MVEDLLAQTEKMFTQVEMETFIVEIKVAIGASGIMEAGIRDSDRHKTRRATVC